MSKVTDIILICSCGKQDAQLVYQELNAWLKEKDCDMILKPIDEHAGGNRAMQLSIFAGAFNHFNIPIQDFCHHVADMKWDVPKSVTLIIQEENDESPVVVLKEGEWCWS